MRAFRQSAIWTAALISLCVANADVEYQFIHVDDFLTNYGLGECYIYDLNNEGVGCGTATYEFKWPNGSTTITYTGFYISPDFKKTAISLSWPRGISDTGLIAGVQQIYDIGTGAFTNVPFLSGTYPPLALNGINDAGVAVGYVQICNCSNSQGTLQWAYVYDPGQGAFSLPVPGANGASRINNNGLVVGWIGGWAAVDGFIYDLKTSQYTIASSLFSGPNTQTTAVDVNDNDVVVGMRKNENGSIAWGYTWSPAKGVTLLPLPPAGYQPFVKPASINNAGQIVGSIYTSNATQRPFIYDEKNGIRDLTTLCTPPPGFNMMTATAINDQGWIAGYGNGGGFGFYTSFILKPLVTGDINGDGKVDQQDLGILLSAFGTCTGQPGFVPEADLDKDGCIGQGDLGVLLANYGK